MARNGVEVRVYGDRAVLKALKELPKAVRNKVLRQAVRKGMKRMKQLVAGSFYMPVDSGTMRKALIIRAKKGRKRGTILLELQYNTDKIKGRAPNEFFYASVIEYGDSHRPGDAPMRRTFDEYATDIRDEVQSEVAVGVLRVADELGASAGGGAGSGSGSAGG